MKYCPRNSGHAPKSRYKHTSLLLRANEMHAILESCPELLLILQFSRRILTFFGTPKNVQS